MDEDLDPDPAHAPPAASPPAAAPAAVISPYDEMVRFVFPVGAVVGLMNGVVICRQSLYALSQFDAEKNAPGLVFVAVLRSLGAVSAMFAAAFTAVLVLHRAGRRASGSLEVDHAHTYLVLLTFPFLVAVTTSFGVLGCLLTWLAGSWGTMRGFLPSIRDFTLWTDFLFLPFGAVVVGGSTTGLLLLGAGFLTTKKHGLALKFFVAYVAIQLIKLIHMAFLNVVLDLAAGP